MSSPSRQPVFTKLNATSPGNAALGVSMRWFFFFFCVSGFCGVLYELVWLRLAMAQFGVTSALVSIVLSAFMAGLGIGSWISGAYLRKHAEKIRYPLRWYALAELFIGASAILVPYELLWGRHALEGSGISASWAYYLASGILVAVTLVPWCACMGATIPIAMLAIRKQLANESPRSFSFLYLSNVLGAIGGATFPLLLIELRGFRGTLWIAAALNGMLALAAFALTLKTGRQTASPSVTELTPDRAPIPAAKHSQSLVLLFISGMTSMGIEVIWIRQFTPFLGTVVYAFATILSLYLLATFVGSQIYRRWSRKHIQESGLIWLFIGVAALLALIGADLRIGQGLLWRLILGIAPFSALLGFVTPLLVDRWSGGDPARAGKAYAVNVVGCIVGPLIAGFILLPHMSERWALFTMAAPWLVISLTPQTVYGKRSAWQTAIAYGLIAASLAGVLLAKGFEDIFSPRLVLRDNTATVVATGEGDSKALYVNGVNMSLITTVTKYMAHMPLAYLDRPPKNALVICFGMGTTFRSLLSWKISATAVDLVPSVPKAFSYYHSDGNRLLQSPLAHVIIDDGRRFLERTTESYDVITIDPPPPVPAAGSSLLYSRDFYAIVKHRLQPGGIVQQWLPSGDPTVRSAVTQALQQSFPYLRVFRSAGGMGFHFLASDRPIPNLSADELAARMPASAVADFVEWGPASSPQLQFGLVLGKEVPVAQMIKMAPNAPVLEDDHPVNEYYLIRHRGELVGY